MKRAYTKPAMQATEIQQSYLICTSDWDVMGPGQSNQPAGAPSFGARNGWGGWNTSL